MSTAPPAAERFAVLRAVVSAPGWSDLPCDVRRQQLACYLAKHPECAELPEMAGVAPDALARPALAHLAGLVQGSVRPARTAVAAREVGGC